MKYHIAVKFLAVMLCALFLLSAVGSGVAILALTEMELYEKSVDQLYQESLTGLSEVVAGRTATRYASKTLGGCADEMMLSSYGDIFTPGYYAYILYDPDGNAVEQVDFDEDVYADAHTYSQTTRFFNITLTGREYKKVISAEPASTEETLSDREGDLYFYNAVFSDGVMFDRCIIQDINGQWFTLDMGFGHLSYDEDTGKVVLVVEDPYLCPPNMVQQLTYANFMYHGERLFEISNPDGMADFYYNADGLLDRIVFDTYLIAEETAEEDPIVLVNYVPPEGAEVWQIDITFADGSSTASLEGSLGVLSYDGGGAIQFMAYDSMDPYGDGLVTSITFFDENDNLLYLAYSHDQDPVGVFYESKGTCYFSSLIAQTNSAKEAEATDPTAVTEPDPETDPETTLAPEATVPASTTEIPTEAIIAEVTTPTEAPTTESGQDLHSTRYWDSQLQEYIEVQYTYEPLPEGYRMELWLLPGAYEMDAVYDLLHLAWQYRTELFYILGGSLLLFAIFAVYLCCAAGKKPGREDVRAGGLNAMSLDLYLTLTGTALCILFILGYEGGDYLLRYSPNVVTQYILIDGYLAALIIVGFCFACAAQFKTPGGYWWRNTLTVRLLTLFGRFMQKVEGFLRYFLGKFFPGLGKITVFCWNRGIDLTVRGFRRLEKIMTRLGHAIGKIFRKIALWVHAFLVLLPVTWQWLLIGGMLLFVLVLALLTRTEFFIMLSVLAGVALVVYGSHCFGLLLDATRRMGKGDLNIKVDDKLMVGSFREFAQDLNALGDVVVIAAQQQMQSERMKAELITNVSHDIKTPLTSIINYVDLLQKPHSDQEQEAYLEVLSRQSLRMKKLLEDLIEMSKASTGNMAVNITRINAGEAVTQALGEFADKLEKAQLTPVIRQPDAPVYIQADGRLVWRVLSNLLSNMVKYALPGTRVYIDLLPEEDRVQISMKNISREALNVSAEELMERFVRGDASRNTDGSGLGLNIAQSLTEIQKGRLDLTVDGDLFKVTLTFPVSDA